MIQGFPKLLYPPLLPAFACLAAGILLAAFFPGLSLLQKGLVLTVLFVAGTWFFKAPLPILLSSLAAGVWGVGAMNGLVNPGQGFLSLASQADGTAYTITGRIDSFAREYPLKTQYILACERLTPSKARTPIPVKGRILFSAYRTEDSRPALRYGDRIRVTAKLRPIRNFSNPGGFDYKWYQALKGIAASASAKADMIRVMDDTGVSFKIRALRAVQGIRQHCHRTILSRAGPPAKVQGRENKDLATPRAAAAVLSAMVLGKREGLGPALKDGFAKTGVSHILSISGLHLAIIGFLAYGFILNLFRPWQTLVILGRARKLALCLSLFPLVVYAVLAGFSPATQRALIMTAVFIIAIASEQETDPLNTLCLAGIIILALDPSALFSISFQLSFVAVASIIVGMVWAHKTERIIPHPPVLRFCSSVFWVSLFAATGTQILIARYFNMVSHIQLLSNLILVPVLGMVILPVGVCAMVFVFVYPSLSNGMIDLAIHLVQVCLAGIDTLSKFSWTWSRIITPTMGEVGIYYLGLLGIWAWFSGKRHIGIPLVATALAAASVCTAVAVKHRYFRDTLSVTVLDVGQGAASLAHTPGGKIILLDCGGFSSDTGFNVGRYVVGPFLWRERIKTIDAVILSHPQSDHMNGLSFILDNFHVGLFVCNSDRSEHLDALLRLVDEKHIPLQQPGIGTQTLNFGSVKLILFPSPKPFGLNNDSLVCRLEFRAFSMLFPGDIEHRREEWIDMPARSRVMLSPHHGSRGASSKIFLDQVKPESVIVSCGFMNRYGFPHPEVLERYKALKVNVFRTDLRGAVTVRTAGTGYDIITNRKH